MTERFEMDVNELFLEYSKDVEEAWRIITRPQDYPGTKVEMAEDFLEKMREQILDSINLESTDEEINVCEDIMLGIYHYSVVMPPSGLPDEIGLN